MSTALKQCVNNVLTVSALQICCCIGPYKGRSSELHSYVSGILTNPNCEYEANYIALHTLAQWSNCTHGDNNEESKDEVTGQLTLRKKVIV